MKKFLLSLAAVGIASHAMAEELTYFYSENYEGESVTADWVSAITDRYTVSIEQEGEGENANSYLQVKSVGTGGNGTTITNNAIGQVAEGTDFTMTFKLKLTGGNGQLSNFYIYDKANTAILRLELTATNATTWKVNEDGNKIVDLSKTEWNKIQLSVKGNITYLSVNDSEISIIPTLFTKGGISKAVFDTKRYYAGMAIDDVVVRELLDDDVPATTPVNYTIKYVDEENNSIKDDVTVTSTVGTSISASEAQMAAINMNGQKYIYKSGNDAMTLAADAESNVMTLVFRKAATVNYVVKAMCGEEEIAEIAKGTAFEGDAKSIAFSRFILNDGAFYSTNSLSGDYFHYAATLGETDGNFAINYTKQEKEVVFCSEAENIEGMTVGEGNSTRASNGKTGRSDNEVTVTNLAPGKYKITAVMQGNTGATATFTVGEAKFEAATTGSAADKTSEEIVVNEATNVVLTCAGMGSAKGLDLVYIEKTGDVEPESEPTNVEDINTISNGAIYDLSGRRVSTPVKGEIYIQNGKKFVVK